MMTSTDFTLTIHVLKARDIFKYLAESRLFCIIKEGGEHRVSILLELMSTQVVSEE